MANKRFQSLYDAIQNGTAADVRLLLASGANPNEVEEWGDVTALMYAAQRGDLAIVKALVEGGADVNALAEDLSGDLDEFEYLDDAFQAADLHGMTALVYAIVYGHNQVKTYLFKVTNPELQKQARAVERHARQHEGE